MQQKPWNPCVVSFLLDWEHLIFSLDHVILTRIISGPLSRVSTDAQHAALTLRVLVLQHHLCL